MIFESLSSDLSKLIDFETWDFETILENILKLAGATLAGLTVIYCGKLWHTYGFFKRRGISTPKFRFFFGNQLEILRDNYSDCLIEWTKKYGKTYGIFEGHTPILVTSDLDMINEIFIKQFNNFSARKKLPIQVSDSDRNTMIAMSSRTQWKRMRTIMNPTFTAAKLKELLPCMNLCSDRLIEIFEKNSDNEVSLNVLFKRFTMDTLWNSAFGLDIDCQNKPDNTFFKRAVNFVESTAKLNLLFFLSTFVCELKFIWIPLFGVATFVLSRLNSNWGYSIFWLIQQSHQILEKRLNEKVYRRDYIQLLIDSQSDNVEKSLDKQIYDHNLTKIEKKLTFEEIQMSLVQFLIAGYETTSTALCYCMFVLATNPHEMRKLQEEIDANFYSDSEFEMSNEKINSLYYLDMFVREVLRMYPIGVAFTNRRCTHATLVNGIDIPEDLVVAVDVLSVHYDMENWGPVDTYQFYPLRHSAEFNRNPACYLPFGYGPRNCLEMKLMLIKVLLKFDVVRGPNTPDKLSFIEGFTFRRPKTTIQVLLRKRY